MNYIKLLNLIDKILVNVFTVSIVIILICFLLVGCGDLNLPSEVKVTKEEITTTKTITVTDDQTTEITEDNNDHHLSNMMLIATKADLPLCDETNQDYMYYVSGTKLFYVCQEDGEYEEIDLKGEPGEPGEPGADGKDGTSTTTTTATATATATATTTTATPAPAPVVKKPKVFTPGLLGKGMTKAQALDVLGSGGTVSSDYKGNARWEYDYQSENAPCCEIYCTVTFDDNDLVKDSSGLKSTCIDILNW